MISLLKYSKENRYPQVKCKEKNSKKPIYNSIVIKKKEYLEAQQSYFQAQYFKVSKNIKFKKRIKVIHVTNHAL